MKTFESFQTELHSLEWVGKSYAVLTMARPEDFIFLPGQHTRVQMNDDQGSLERIYSIASRPHLKTKHSSEEQSILRFVVQTSDLQVKRFLEKPAGKVTWTLSEASGNFLLQKHSKQNVFIAGGSGIAPLISMIESYLDQGKNSTPTTLIYGCRNEDFPLLKEIQTLFLNSQNQHRLQLVSEASSSQSLPKGTVITALELLSLEGDQTHFYLCGPLSMIKSVKEHLRIAKIPENKIHFERY